jgi:U6 snRNA-associated Sm-like protein LSm8
MNDRELGGWLYGAELENADTLLFYLCVLLVGTQTSFLESICLVTTDGRMIFGILIGHDNLQNMILNEAVERVYSEEAAVEEVPLGLYVIRGDHLVLVGEYDLDSLADTAAHIRVPAPLPAIQQHQF